MNKLLMVLSSLVSASSALAQTPVTPAPLPLPGAGGLNAPTGGARGMSGIRFVQAPVPLDANCSSVIVQGNSQFVNDYFVLPRAFISVTQTGQSQMELVPPAKGGAASPTNPYRLRFNLFFPHDVNGALAARRGTAEAASYGHGCNFKQIENKLNEQYWNTLSPDQRQKLYQNITYTYVDLGGGNSQRIPKTVQLLPAVPYKVNVTIPGVGSGQIGGDDTSVLQLYGWDHTVEIPITDQSALTNFLRDFDTAHKKPGEPVIGVPVQIDIRFAGARPNGAISCTFDSSKLETSLKTQLKARAALPDTGPFAGMINLAKVNLKAELSKAALDAKTGCQIDGSSTDAFNNLAFNMVTAALQDPNMLPQMQAAQAGMPNTGLPGVPPLAGGGFSPLPPLPLSPGGTLPPCIGQDGNPTDPATFASQNQGAQCTEVGSGMDETKKYIKFDMMFSRVKSVVSKGLNVSFNAASTDEVFTTFTKLAGRMKKPWEAPLMVRSTPAYNGNPEPYRTGVDLKAGRTVWITPTQKEKRVFDYSQPEDRYATWTDILQLKARGIAFGQSLEKSHLPGSRSTSNLIAFEELPPTEKDSDVGLETDYPKFVIDTSGTTWWFGGGKIAYKIITRVPRPGRIDRFQLQPDLRANASAEATALFGDAAISGISVGFTRKNGELTSSIPFAKMLEPNSQFDAQKVKFGNNWALKLTAKADLGELVLYNMDFSDCLDTVSPSDKRCKLSWSQRVFVEWTGHSGHYECKDFSSVQGLWVNGCPEQKGGEYTNFDVGYLKSYDRDEYKEFMERNVSMTTVKLDTNIPEDPKDDKVLEPLPITNGMTSDGKGVTTSDGGLAPAPVVVGQSSNMTGIVVPARAAGSM